MFFQEIYDEGHPLDSVRIYEIIGITDSVIFYSTVDFFLDEYSNPFSRFACIGQHEPP